MICKIRLATTQVLLARGYIIENWRLPSPTLPIYSDHSQKVALSDGGQVLRGFLSFSLNWDILDSLQRRTIRRIAEESRDSVDGLIYATVNRSWIGAGGTDDYIDVSGRAHIPDIVPIGNSNGLASSGITLVVRNLTIVADPASF